ncbi:2Fe-2S iron-sulfur cluster-binding protein (plasmid) [Halobaculum sp. CBA1158]|uniref:2Fe-2S iron-sulfur cluster-binding protein n=1 Tax=Halobaculum sp. CBA1158 TaxID=2904243 RepID=UPI001F3CFCDB|nr:2Fe-2S iron-sulfur cluster-binding protein [Halobaculum sp. CBA1158]UIP01497.1 2Fe-2S iron-sulfur cluster-binding protein [Halobaculum sp. CBA1158]
MVETYEVEFVEEGVTVEVPANKSILDVAEEMGLQLPYRCRRGICGVCCAQREEGGEVDQSEGMFLSPSEEEEGYVLTCVGKPLSDLRIETNSAP